MIPRGLGRFIQDHATTLSKFASRTVSEVLDSSVAPQWDWGVVPLGHGSWGVVYPLADDRFVIKVTADPTEGPVVATIMSEPALHDHMGIIHYFALRQASEPVVFRGRPQKVYVIIAERLKNVGALANSYWRYSEHRPLVRQLDQVRYAATELKKEIQRKRPSYKLAARQDAYVDAIQKVQDGPLSDFFIQFYDITDGGVLADVHLNNLGQRAVDWDTLTDSRRYGHVPLSPNDSYWVISDPGHSAVERVVDIAELRENPRRR